MGGPNTSMSSAKSQPGGRRNPADEQKWHPNRHLSYYWKRDHDFLRQQVETGSIAYNTALDLEIEHCELDRTDAVSLRSPWNHFSLRPSYEGGRHSGGPEYNRYMKIRTAWCLPAAEASFCLHGFLLKVSGLIIVNCSNALNPTQKPLKRVHVSVH